jgi:hypothetical protein
VAKRPDTDTDDDVREIVARYGRESIYAAAAYVTTEELGRAAWARTILTQAVMSRPVEVTIRRGPIPRPPKPAERPRGRPRRQIDRDRVRAALIDTEGRLREAARRCNLPLSTLQSYLAREPIPEHHYTYGHGLRPEHCDLLHASGIRPAVALARGYASSKLGLDIPIWDARGQQMWVQTRLDNPRKRSRRYRNGRGAHAVLDVCPYMRRMLFERERTLYVVESPRKADAGVSRGLACVAVQGAHMVCTDAAEWNHIGVDGRDVVIVFDGDAMLKPDVRASERRLWEFLTELGARVRVAVLPHAMGLDDYLASGRSVDDLAAQVTGYSEARPSSRPEYCGHVHCSRMLPARRWRGQTYCSPRCRPATSVAWCRPCQEGQ